MNASPPRKTLADYMVIGISPALIMVLVGSLCFFLVQVFYRGAAVGSVRWVLFWFVIAVVLVARIGIEQGSGRATAYGLALALATWLYLWRLHPAFVLGFLLLGMVWWCANQLTRDCTLIDDDADASGHGLLQRAPLETRSPAPAQKKARQPSGGKNEKRRSPAPHAPGRWVVYFSLAALPLFGVGQMLLPGGDAESRRRGFTWLIAYLAAALGLLLTTSFLGLRRYLRQRQLQMPAIIAFGWIRFGAVAALMVLALALVLPRPGATATWRALRYQIDYQLHQASEWAAKVNPAGQGHGRPGNDTGDSGRTNSSANSESSPGEGHGQTGTQTAPGPPDHSTNDPDAPSSAESPAPAPRSDAWLRVFRTLLLWFVAALLCGALLRYRHLIARMIRSFAATVAQFFRNLFTVRGRPVRAGSERARPPQRRFDAYENPFITGKDRSWTPEELILYSYEAIRTWAVEHGARPQPQQTAREFCLDLSRQFPEVVLELKQLSLLYGHAAYGKKAPDPCDLEPVRRLWRFVSGSLS